MTSLAAFPNYRPLGGQRTASGGVVRTGLVYRSEALLAPGAADAALLSQANIALVCDLRSAAERERAPNRWWIERRTDRVEFDLLDALAEAHRPWAALRRMPDAMGAGAAMRGLYAGLPAAAAGHIAQLFRLIAAGRLPLLIHCTAGKDRTGFLSAMLLAALEVPFAAIVRDYLASRVTHSAEAIAATLAMAVANIGAPLPDDALAVLLGVNEAYLRESFAAIERDHGGIAGYLAAAGLSGEEVDALRLRLIDPAPYPIT